MKVLERTIQLYRKVDNNEPMEEMHKRVMEGLSKIEAPLGLKDSEIPKTPDFGAELICFYYAKNITNRTDLEQAFKLSSGGDQDGHKFLEWKEHVYQSTPKEFGIWRITAHITACGTTQTLPYVARAAEDPMKDITFETDNAGGCNPAVKAVRYGYYAPYIPVYYVLERYPAHFDPNAAGFYKIHTSHPDMQDKFLNELNNL